MISNLIKPDLQHAHCLCLPLLVSASTRLGVYLPAPFYFSRAFNHGVAQLHLVGRMRCPPITDITHAVYSSWVPDLWYACMYYVYMYICMHVCMFVYKYICMHMYACTYYSTFVSNKCRYTYKHKQNFLQTVSELWHRLLYIRLWAILISPCILCLSAPLW